MDMEYGDEPMVDPSTGQKILRPRNAWILYRKTRLNDIAPLPDGSRQPMAKASSIISSWWRNESKDIKRKFEMLAAQEKAEHKRRYPEYKYKPRTSHQIAKAKEKKKTAKKIEKAKDKDKKARTRESGPSVTAVSSSVHTSYIEAALAHQAASTQVIQHDAAGPPHPLSPPLSLDSTPVTTPSSLLLSEFEQGSSSSTATSSHTTSSPVDTLGLALSPPTFNFQCQQITLRAPRHIPARIAPRSRGNRQVSLASTDASVQSSSVSTMASPITTTSASLSPLSWPLPTSHSYLPSPESDDEQLSADLRHPPPSTELSWVEASSDLSSAQSDSVFIDLV